MLVLFVGTSKVILFVILTESTRPGRLQALPHHLPKMDSLSKKLVEIRNTMGEEVLVQLGLESKLSIPHSIF